MKQTYTSAATSVNARKIPKVYGKIPALRPGSLLFDYGCGRYTDHIAAALPGVVYLAYDPFNQPEDVNARSVYYMRCAMRAHLPVTIVCSNVLNVIDNENALQDIANQIMQFVFQTGGTAYITVYQGDHSGTGRQTGPDQWQRNEPLSDYLRLFPLHAIIHDGIAIKTGGHIERGMIVVTREEVKA